MEDTKKIVAKNIQELRQSAGMTQLDFAEKLHYSDKAVSKWERGESLPDVTVLLKIAALFGVSLNYLVEETHAAPAAPATKAGENAAARQNKFRRHALGTLVAVLIVWLIATVAFVTLDLSIGGVRYHWLAFVAALPASSVVWLVFNSLWFDRHRNYLIISALMWSLLAAAFLFCFAFGHAPWQIFVLGAPGQILLLLLSRIGIHKEKDH